MRSTFPRDFYIYISYYTEKKIEKNYKLALTQ
jgi:hypothetical protein